MNNSISRFLLAFVAFAGITLSLSAASPNLGSVLPRGAQRGTEVEVTFTGARLEDAKELLFYKKGIETTKLTLVNANQFKATLKVEPNAELGEYGVRVRTATGISELRTFYVGALPVIQEKEPNSEFSTPQKIDMNVTVHGVVSNEDADYFLVEAKKGQRISAEVEGMRLGTTVFDPFVAIINMKRFELNSRDDAPMTLQDCFASIVAPEDGTYVILVRESAYGGNGNCHYRLHVGNFPRPTGVYPTGGQAGQELEVTFLGDPAGSFKQKIKLPAVADPDYRVFAQDASGICPSGIKFSISNHPNAFEVEPNDTPATATAVAFPAAFNGVIEKVGDVDCFKFHGVKGAFDVRCIARKQGSPLDPIMTLSLTGAGNVASNDDSGGPDSYFRVNLDDKDYILTISDHLKKGGPDYTYRVEFTPVQGSTFVQIPKVAQYSQERQVISVPKGNRFATLMTVQRRDLAGDLKLIAENLPAGISMHVDPILNGIDSMAVVFEASPQANIGGNLAEIKALPADTNVPCKTEFHTNAELTFGNPGQSIYWRFNMSKLGIAVTEESPYSIEVIEPKAPLVQNGSVKIKVVAKRKEGFKGAINVIPVYNAPGIGTVSSITIPENQNEGFFTMNANGNAQVRKWKTSLLANAATPGGTVWVSSQLFSIEIAPPFVAAKLERVAVEQGKSGEIVCKLTNNTPFEGDGKIELVGLPPKVVVKSMDFKNDTKEVVFKVEVDPASPVGNHKNIICAATVQKSGEEVAHTLGRTEIRIDPPAAPKVTANAPMPNATAKPATPNAPEKRLSRLEKLRLEQEEREKSQKTEPKK